MGDDDSSALHHVPPSRKLSISMVKMLKGSENNAYRAAHDLSSQGLDAFETTVLFDQHCLEEHFHSNGKVAHNIKYAHFPKGSKKARAQALRYWRHELSGLASCSNMVCGLGPDHRLARVTGKLPYCTQAPNTAVRCSMNGCLSG